MDASVAPNPVGAFPAATDAERSATAAAAELACSREMIHLSGTIQPHGALLAIDPSRDWTVVAARCNAADFMPTRPSAGIVGHCLAAVLGPRFAETVQRRFHDGKLRGASPWQSSLWNWNGRVRHGFARLWVEWELEIAETLRHGITEVIVRSLRRIDELHDTLRQSQTSKIRVMM